MIHPTYTHPGVNAALLELSRSRGRVIRWRRILSSPVQLKRVIALELRQQNGLLAKLERIGA